MLYPTSALLRIASESRVSQGRSLVRERRRAARLLALLAALFAACWLPYHVLTVVMDFLPTSPPLMTLLRYSLLLGHANSAVNPLVYCFMTRAFRHSARQLLRMPRRPGAAGGLAARALQRRKVRARSATSSSGYDSYQSPRRCAALPLRALRHGGAAAAAASATAAGQPPAHAAACAATGSTALGTCSGRRSRTAGSAGRPALVIAGQGGGFSP
ncbi:Octopamine receptor [Gryllus bimaculatus]|nr:Octopamine receptor [Gryllus bimaculatus]